MFETEWPKQRPDVTDRQPGRSVDEGRDGERVDPEFAIEEAVLWGPIGVDERDLAGEVTDPQRAGGGPVGDGGFEVLEVEAGGKAGEVDEAPPAEDEPLVGDRGLVVRGEQLDRDAVGGEPGIGCVAECQRRAVDIDERSAERPQGFLGEVRVGADEVGEPKAEEARLDLGQGQVGGERSGIDALAEGEAVGLATVDDVTVEDGVVVRVDPADERLEREAEQEAGSIEIGEQVAAERLPARQTVERDRRHGCAEPEFGQWRRPERRGPERRGVERRGTERAGPEWRRTER